MQFNLRIMSILFLLVVMLSTAFAACDVFVDNFEVKLRADGSYDNEIIAPENENIDIQITYFIDDYSGTTCPTNLTVRAEISKYNNSTSSWMFDENKTETKSLVRNNSYTVSFPNEFNTGTNSNYTRFRVRAFLYNGSEEIETAEAFVDVEDDSCDNLRINTTSIVVDEGSSATKTFTIENNSNLDFRISSIESSSSSSIIDFENIDYSQYIYSNSDQDIDVTVNADDVSYNTTVTAYLSVAGYLGNNYCSVSKIGRESFSVRVENNSGSSTGSSSDCDDIDIQTRFTEYNESTTQKLIFGIKNNSTKRFEILAIEPYSSSFTLNKYFNEKYIFSGQTADLILNAILPSVTQNRTLQGTVKVRGVFSDGKSCSFTQIGTKTFDVNVIDSSNTLINPNCAGFNISAPESLNVENYGSFAFTITNATNRTASIIVEGSIDVSPTVIVLPKNSSLSRTINVQMNSSSGFVKFIPIIEGCNVQEKIVQLKNTASGLLTESEMNLSIERDYNLNVITLITEIQNPTNKVFNGILKIDSPEGWPDLEKEVVVVPGKNNFVERLGASGSTQEGTIRVSFSSGGKIISESVNTTEQNNLSLTGLFAFGSNFGILGLILLIVLVVVIIVGVIETSPKAKAQSEQEWVNNKN